MPEWSNDRRDEPGDDQHDDSTERPEGEPSDRPADGDEADTDVDTDTDAVPDADGRDPIGTDAESPDDGRDIEIQDGDGEGDDDDREARRTADDTDREPSGTVDDADSGSRDSGDNWLSTLIDALERLDRGSSSGQRRTDRTVLDYDISIGTGLDSADDEPSERRSATAGGSRSTERPGRAGGERRKQRRSGGGGGGGGGDAHHLTTRSTADELQVTADVASADPAEITVGFDDDTLVVAVAGRELDRVDVPWRDRSADATIKNGILTVRVTPESDTTGAISGADVDE